MNQKGFSFNINRCTGCQACVVACTLENVGQQSVNWREVYTFNEDHHPRLPLFHISMACNHCQKPLCLENCPAAAYVKDGRTGAVLHDADRCLGCQYCTWACPYDAPKMNRGKGVIEKCHLCHDRINDGMKPACTVNCPSGALEFIDLENTVSPVGVSGFTQAGLDPALKLIPLRERQRQPECSSPPAEIAVRRLFKPGPVPLVPKISLKSEWVLWIFTTIAFILVASFTSSLLSDWRMNPFFFLVPGLLAMALSIKHLGKKKRAYRAVLNWKTSWLSREIILFSVFLGLSGLVLFRMVQTAWLAWLTAVIGFFSLYAIDKIYQVAMKVGLLNFHSAQVLFSGFYLTGVLTQNGFLGVFFACLKIVLYLYRKVQFMRTGRNPRPVISSLRLILGFFLPLGWLFFAENHHIVYYYGLTASVWLGEIIDRGEYYEELEIITPRKQMLIDLKQMLELQESTEVRTWKKKN